MVEDYIPDIGEDERVKLNLFMKMLQEHNKMYNLTAITEEKDIIIKHFYDSIAPKNLFPRGVKVAEIGSGAGFPSVPLKIVRNDLIFTLIESTGKKCNFLNNVVENLKLDGVQVLCMRAEDGARDINLREKFDICCARAVARLNTLCEYCLPYVKVGGKFIAYKGDASEEIEESMGAIKILGGKMTAQVNYELPEGMGKRTALVIEKVAPTPLKYPRGRGLERKKPL